MRKRDYNWYVEPLDSDTNLAVSMQLPEENSGQYVCTTDNQHHNLWKCSFLQASFFWRSKVRLGLNLNIYSQEGSGEIRPCNFLFPRKKKANLKTAS